MKNLSQTDGLFLSLRYTGSPKKGNARLVKSVSEMKELKTHAFWCKFDQILMTTTKINDI